MQSEAAEREEHIFLNIKPLPPKRLRKRLASLLLEVPLGGLAVTAFT